MRVKKTVGSTEQNLLTFVPKPGDERLGVWVKHTAASGSGTFRVLVRGAEVATQSFGAGAGAFFLEVDLYADAYDLAASVSSGTSTLTVETYRRGCSCGR